MLGFLPYFVLLVSFVAIREEQKLKWKDDDGLEVKIIKPDQGRGCKLKSQEGDCPLEQYYRLTDKEGRKLEAISERSHTHLPSEKGGLLPIWSELSDSETREVNATSVVEDQTLYYTVQLVDLFRPNPGEKWTDEDGLVIETEQSLTRRGLVMPPSSSVSETMKIIKGMDRAMTAMCEGERRKVIIPYELGYGEEGRPI
ncbi:unnamed protein product, partial [Mesorhabditis spiculigera]